MGNKQIEKKHNPTNANMPVNSDQLSTAHQIAFTAAGAAGSALLGAILARKGYAPKTISAVIAALGAALVGIADSEIFRALGAGAMSGSGAQLVLMLFAEHEEKKKVATTSPTNAGSDGHVPAPAEAANANVVPLAAKAVAS